MKKIVTYFLCVTILFLLFPRTVYADIGPTESIVIDFKGLENENYFVTLLSENPPIGPHTAFNENSDSQVPDEDSIRSKFASYKDEDGYYFLQFYSDCSETSRFTWNYFPPYTFKILIYFPDVDSFMVSSDVYKKYALDSYYTAHITEEEMQLTENDNGGIQVKRSYDYTWEIFSLLARIAATLVIEIAIALLFGFKAKKQLLVILFTNIITQSVLNISLNIMNSDSMTIWMEFLIIAIEAVIYYIYLNRFSGKQLVNKWIAPLYALAANIASFGIGLFIAQIIPGIF